MKELNSAREQLSWDNFASVPIEKTTQLKKIYNSFISIIKSSAYLILLMCRKKAYDLIDINEMAYAVYNATINPKQRKDVEQHYGKGLQQS